MNAVLQLEKRAHIVLAIGAVCFVVSLHVAYRHVVSDVP